MPLNLIRTSAPAAAPLTLAEAKTHLRVDHSFDDDLITRLLLAASSIAEEITGRSLITQTWRLNLDEFPASDGGMIELLRPPVASVTTVKYYDTDNVQQTLSSALYEVDTAACPARLMPVYGEVWPDTYQKFNAVEIIYSAGYGASGSSVPQDIRAAVALILGDLYEHREDTVIGNIVNDLPRGAQTLLAMHRVLTL